jgi:peroxiredoxin
MTRILLSLLTAITFSACGVVSTSTPAPEGYASTLAAQTMAVSDSDAAGDETSQVAQEPGEEDAPVIRDTQSGSDILVDGATATLPRAATATPKYTLPPPPPSVTPAPGLDIEGLVETGLPTVLPLLTEVLSPGGGVDGPGMLEVAPEIGALAPDFALVDARTGERVQLSALEGQPVLINFWATWCVFCVDEMPTIQKAYERHESEGLVVLAVDVQETRSKAANFGDHLGVTFNLLMDSEGAVADEYRVSTMPTSYFVDRVGVIQSIAVGEMDREILDWHLATILE